MLPSCPAHNPTKPPVQRNLGAVTVGHTLAGYNLAGWLAGCKGVQSVHFHVALAAHQDTHACTPLDSLCGRATPAKAPAQASHSASADECGTAAAAVHNNPARPAPCRRVDNCCLSRPPCRKSKTQPPQPSSTLQAYKHPACTPASTNGSSANSTPSGQLRSSLQVPELRVNNLPVLLPAAAAATTRQRLIVILIQHDRVTFRHAHLVQAARHNSAAACGSRHTHFRSWEDSACCCCCQLAASAWFVPTQLVHACSRRSPLSSSCPRAAL